MVKKKAACYQQKIYNQNFYKKMQQYDNYHIPNSELVLHLTNLNNYRIFVNYNTFKAIHF